MNLSQQVEEIRAACIKANPEIEQRNITKIRNGHGETIDVHVDDGRFFRPIRLADVLLAMDEKADGYISFTEWHFFIFHRWNLRTDDLTQQSPECIAFIHSLLKV